MSEMEIIETTAIPSTPKPRVRVTAGGRVKAPKAPKAPKASRPSTALAPVAPVPAPGPMGGALAVFERLAKDPSVDPAKLRELIDLQERIIRLNAKAEFDSAFSDMQAEIPTIKKHGKGKHHKYAKLEDVHAVIKPILKKYGFSIRHKVEWPGPNDIIVRGILSHRAGHSETSDFRTAPDQSDVNSQGKSIRPVIQDQGSAVAYGRRYTTKDLLNIAEEGEDVDGDRREPRAERPHPTGEDYISQEKRARLWTVAKKADRTETEIRMWLKVARKLDDTAHILNKDYPGILSAIEAPGALPLPTEPEPGA